MKIFRQTLVIASIMLLATGTCSAQGTKTVRAIEPVERNALFPSGKTLDQGRTVARSACSSCHGMDGISDQPGKPHLAGQRTVYTYRILQAYQQSKRAEDSGQHNNFLNNEALLAVSAYYASLTPAFHAVDPDKSESTESTESAESAESTKAVEPPVEAAATEQATAPQDDPFLGIRKKMKKCIKCHDETGNSSGSGMPSLAAQHPEYFVSSMQAYVDGSRSHKMMRKLAGKLDEAEIRQMGVFYAVQNPLRTETLGEGDAKVGSRMTEDCDLCHGADGNASSDNMPTLAGQDARYFVKAMKAYKSGKRQHEDMFEVVEQIDEEDFEHMAAFYAAQEPIQRDVRTPLNSSQWLRRCERCHGIEGNSTDPRFPMLAGQDETYLKSSMDAYANGQRRNSMMRAMAEPLSKVDIDYIGTYFASRLPKAVVYMQLPCDNDD